MSGIQLDPKEGLNAKLAVCERCGKDTGEILLMGNKGFVTHCRSCNVRLIGGGKCPKCGERGTDKKKIVGQTIPMGLCDVCKKKEAEEMREAIIEVQRGGIFWRCKDCKSEGAIRADSPICREVRRQTNTPPDKPVGIEFGKNDGCPVCSDKESN